MLTKKETLTETTRPGAAQKVRENKASTKEQNNERQRENACI